MPLPSRSQTINFGVAAAPLLFFVLIGVNAIRYWITPYDSWRILQCVMLALCLLGYSLLSMLGSSNQGKWLSKKSVGTLAISKGMLMLLLTASSIAIVTIYHAVSAKLALLDAMLLLALYCYGYITYLAFKAIPTAIIERLIAIIVLLPIYYVILLLIAWLLYFTQAMPPVAWHIWFDNVRYFDDTLLPLIFLLWSQPGFLKRHRAVSVVLASCYLLLLWLDGARANWLGIATGLIMVCMFYRQGYKKLLLPVTSVIASYIMFKGLSAVESDSVAYDIARTTSSGRATMWIETLKAWAEQPLIGIGGGNFVYLAPQVNHTLGHPHNIILQWLIEWGVVGIMLVVMAGYALYKLIKQPNNMPPMLFAGCFALVVNMLLSGAQVYPSSQMAMALFFSYAAYQYQLPHHIALGHPPLDTGFANAASKDIVHANTSPNTSKTSTSKTSTSKRRPVQINLAYIGLAAILLVLSIITPSILSQGFNPLDQNLSVGPRFWSNTYAIHLPKIAE